MNNIIINVKELCNKEQSTFLASNKFEDNSYCSYF